MEPMAYDHGQLATQVATLIADTTNIKSMLGDMKSSLGELTASHATMRDFVSAAVPRFTASEEDRRELWIKVNQIKDQEIREVHLKIDFAHEAARVAKATGELAAARSAIAFLWFKLACAGYGALLLAMFYAVLHKA